MAVKKNRDLMVLTRKEGVRKEYPLVATGSFQPKYYPASNVRTPEFRKMADDLARREQNRPPAVRKMLKGMTIRGGSMKK